MIKKFVLLSASAMFIAMPFLASAATLNRQLEIGMEGSDVSTLQTFLAQDATIYPQGKVTGYFGFLTKAAVSNFQVRNNIDSVGRVGPITLAAINAQLAGGITGGGDVYAPSLSGINVNTNRTSVTLSWSGNEQTHGTVYYGTSPLTEYEYPHSVTISGSTATDGIFSASHNVTLNNLQPNTTYYYDVYVTDGSGNASMTRQATFRTSN